jgi:serine/threonine-protein phosphatase 2A regulatory subunit B''
MDTQDLAQQLFRQKFLKWLTCPSSVRLVNHLIDQIQAGSFTPAPTPEFKSMKILSRSHPQSPLPPYSPRRPTLVHEDSEEPSKTRKGVDVPSLKLPKVQSFTFEVADEDARVIESSRAMIPNLLNLSQRLRNVEEEQKERLTIEQCFGPHSLTPDEFSVVVKACGLPSALSPKVYELTKAGNFITLSAFMEFWRENWVGKAKVRLLFDLLRSPTSRCITRSDLVEPLSQLVSRHPSLEFLRGSSDFKQKYIATIIERIFYSVDLNDDGLISLRELQRSQLLSEWTALDYLDDINDSRQFFSYEHFFIIYYRFRELDLDMDSYLTSADLSNYDGFTLSHKSIDLIIGGAGRHKPVSQPGKMDLAEFTWFMLSEEDKTSVRAISYWFKVIDTDLNGLVTAKEIEEFYEETRSRLQLVHQEALTLEEVVCQVSDMTGTDGVFCEKDFQSYPNAGCFLFNLLISLNKYFDLEGTDPYVASQAKLSYPGYSDWDRFALVEYSRLATEEDDFNSPCK